MTYSGYRDVKLSSRVGVILEAISVCIVIAITALIIRNQGTAIDPPQLAISSFKFGGVFSALPFVIFCFVGFESAATLAKESHNPRRNIPIAVIGCAAFAGIFFTLMAYFMVFGIGNDAAALGKSAAPFGDVAVKAGLGWASGVVYLALCLIAPLDLKKSGEMLPRHVVVGGLGAALMSFVIIGSVFPQPEYPYNILPVPFVGYMVVGAIWFAILKIRSPDTLVSIQHDLEG